MTRHSGFLGIFIKNYLPGYIILLVLWSAAHFAIRQFTVTDAISELYQSGKHYFSHTEILLNESVNILKNMNKNGYTTCSISQKKRYEDILRSRRYIYEIGLADENGSVMCLEPFSITERQMLLPLYKDYAPITIGLKNSREDKFPLLVISRRNKNDTRSFVLIKAEDIVHASGFDTDSQKMFMQLSFDNGEHWYEGGEISAKSEGNYAEKITLRGNYPIIMKLYISNLGLEAQHQKLSFFVNCGALILGLFFTLFVLWYRRQTPLSEEFARALMKKEFFPTYQPVVDIQSGEILGAEALVRWRKSDGQIVSAGAFMPYAENSGDIYDITRQLMRKIADDLSEFYSENKELKISINLFAGHFEDRQIVEDIKEIFGGGKIDYAQLMFEVTERLPVRDIDKARNIIAEIRALGARVALDDVGTGHGGLAYLDVLGVDTLKIDKMFVDHLAMEGVSSPIVDMLVGLGNKLKMSVIAEGVETIEQLERLREMGVSMAQGYLFAPPLSGELYIELIRSVTIGEYQLAVDKKTISKDEKNKILGFARRKKGRAKNAA